MEITQMQEKEIHIFETVLAHTAKVISFNRFYVALYDRRNASLYFPLVQLENERPLTLPEIGDGPWTAHPYAPEKQWPDCLLHPDASFPNGSNFQDWLTKHDINYLSVSKPHSWLIAPLKARGTVMGVLVAEDLYRKDAYNIEIKKLFTAIANRTAVTLSNLRLVESLRAVNEVGRCLTSGVRLQEDEILNLIYEQAGRLMDTRDMYVAFYDDLKRELSFPLAYYNGEREAWPARSVDIDVPTEGGLTEEVLRVKTLVCPLNVEAWYQEHHITPAVTPVPKSWLGVPLMVENRILGVISLQNDEIQNLYRPDDIEILQTMASQAAVVLENARLFKDLNSRNEELKKAQTKIVESEAFLVRTSIATDFVHRTNNLVGTIPIWLDQIRDILEKQGIISPQLHICLENIDSDVDDILRAAENLKKPSQAEVINLGEMLQSLVSQVRIQTPSSIGVEIAQVEGPFWVYVVVSELTHAFWSIIENGIEAMPTGGNLSIAIRRPEITNRSEVEVRITDEGKGISPEAQERIFSPFYSTKPSHMGYGLWRAKNVIEGIGGNITFESQTNIGTTFSIRVPLQEPGEGKNGSN